MKFNIYKKFNINILILSVLILVMIFFVFWSLNLNKINNYEIKKIGELHNTMNNPKILRTSQTSKSQYLFINYDIKTSSYILELFNPKTYNTKVLPKSNLKGKFQQFFILPSKNKLININLIKYTNSDICGIDIFDMNTEKWTKLKTNLVIRKWGNEVPSINIAYYNDTPVLLVWGGINYWTNKPQNSMEVLDIFNDKILEFKNINLHGGLSKYSYIIGTKTNLPKEITILSKKIKLLPNEEMYPELFFYTRLIIGTLSSSLDRPTILAISLKHNVLTEYALPTSVKAASDLEITEIPIPKKYNKYFLINAVQPLSKILLIMQHKEKKQKLVLLFSNEKNIKKPKSSDYRFTLISIIDKSLNLVNATYYNTKSLITVDGKNILQITFK